MHDERGRADACCRCRPFPAPLDLNLLLCFSSAEVVTARTGGCRNARHVVVDMSVDADESGSSGVLMICSEYVLESRNVCMYVVTIITYTYVARMLRFIM